MCMRQEWRKPNFKWRVIRWHGVWLITNHFMGMKFAVPQEFKTCEEALIAAHQVNPEEFISKIACMWFDEDKTVAYAKK